MKQSASFARVALDDLLAHFALDATAVVELAAASLLYDADVTIVSAVAAQLNDNKL